MQPLGSIVCWLYSENISLSTRCNTTRLSATLGVFTVATPRSTEMSNLHRNRKNQMSDMNRGKLLELVVLPNLNWLKKERYRVLHLNSFWGLRVHLSDLIGLKLNCKFLTPFLRKWLSKIANFHARKSLT